MHKIVIRVTKKQNKFHALYNYISKRNKEIMSKQTGVLELDKCILSRLWYTSLNVFQINNDNFLKEFHHNCCIDLAELKTVIENLM